MTATELTTLAECLGACHDDPLAFVLSNYPWGQVGHPLQHHAGPDAWQRSFLTELGRMVSKRKFDGHTPVMPIRMAVSSGHGIGKSTLVAWLIEWILSTRPFSRGTVTANISTQLETKTWAALQRWHRWGLTRALFTINSERMFSSQPDLKDSWFVQAQTCKEENSEAFAGQHAENATSFYVFDESSGVPDAIFEVAEGGLTDGEPMFFLFGNPTRNTGKFYEACFGARRDRWSTLIVDSRDARFSNKALIQEWIDDYGEDSDFVRVRVKGLPPAASDAQFIDATRVFAAQKRAGWAAADEPLIAGVDVSGGGAAWTVCRFRRGLDARTKPPIRLTGQQSQDRTRLAAVLAEVLQDRHPDRFVAMMFLDTAFGAPIAEKLRHLGFGDRVTEVQFGGECPSPYQANMRAYMWNRMKDWLVTGTIAKDDRRLEADLMAPGYHLDRRDRLVLESKESMAKRNVASPDDGDALALTFAMPVAPPTSRVVEYEDARESAWS